MNTKKTMRFFNWNPHHDGGFTLVELIVVIAILAILAAVAVPAYSGYIEKANRAGDETLLNTLNKAYASACTLNGTSPALAGNPQIVRADVDNDGEITVSSIKNVAANIISDFQTAFAGNENTEFKVMKSIVFNPLLGMFVDGEAEMTVQFGDKSYTIKMESVSDFMASVFADDIDAMQLQLGGISTAFGTFIGNVETAGTLSPAFKEYLEKNGVQDNELGNATVLYVAQNAGNYSAQDIAQMFQDCSNYMQSTGDTSLGGILNGAFADNQDPLTSAALMYGAVTAFANSDKCTNPNLKNTVANVSNGSDLVNVFMGLEGNTDWQSYIGSQYEGQIQASDQFTTDMNGFLGAMDAINTVSPDIDTSNSDVWNSKEVNDLLGSLFG